MVSGFAWLGGHMFFLHKILIFFICFVISTAVVLAIPSFEQVKNYVAQNPDNIKARYLLGKLYLKKGEPEEALREWKFVVRKRPNLWKVYYKIGMVEYQIGVADETSRGRLKSWKKAMRIWQHIMDADDGSEATKAKSAYLKVKARYQKLANSSDYKPPVTESGEGDESDGKTYSKEELAAMELKAQNFYKDGEYVAAGNLFKTLYKNEYNVKESLFSLGKSVLKEAEEPEKAVEYFTDYGKKYGENAEQMKNLGQAYGLCAEFPNQIRCYKKSIEFGSGIDKADVHFQLALAYDRTAQHSKTIEHAQLAVQLNPDYKKKLQPLIKNSNLAQDVGNIVDEVLRETEDSQLSDEQINEFARRVGDILGEENMNAGGSRLTDMVKNKGSMQDLKDSITGTGGNHRQRSY